MTELAGAIEEAVLALPEVDAVFPAGGTVSALVQQALAAVRPDATPLKVAIRADEGALEIEVVVAAATGRTAVETAAAVRAAVLPLVPYVPEAPAPRVRVRVALISSE